MTRVESIAAAAVDRPDALRAAGGSDAGVQREVNEDRFYCDAARGIFIVIDGVGGQAAGGRAADVANDVLRERLTQQSGSVTERLRDAITAANNDIHRLAATRAEWDGMACVLTAAIVGNGTVTFGHVGDTRLYKLRADQIEKLTRDHSPVGEREDANEISERQAMRHPRRNEVYRDVGSEFHDRRDRDFVDLGEVAVALEVGLVPLEVVQRGPDRLAGRLVGADDVHGVADRLHALLEHEDLVFLGELAGQHQDLLAAHRRSFLVLGDAYAASQPLRMCR